MNRYVVTEIDPESGSLLARSAFRPDYADHISFADVNVRPRTFTTDRTEFLGRNGSVAAPAGMTQGTLAGKIGAGIDPCAAIRVSLLIPPGGQTEVFFLLGEGSDSNEVRKLVRKYQNTAQVQAAWEEVNRFWNKLLESVVLRSASPKLDLLFNRWLPYQILSCRMWARTALYQSSGAYGFRDQLQDAMALVYAFPEETRRHCLRAAARQFTEGDVQHWWHMPSGAGVRTRFCDDYLWLPFVVEHYVRTTGDRSILDEEVPYLNAPPLKPGQDENYIVALVSDAKGSLYEHCLKAIENGLHFGAHGLPLMGTGDWNDGMNKVGAEGRGESVWTGWFLLTILHKFANVCDSRADSKDALRFREQAEELRKNLEANAWDGEWYKRAYFDDGQPLGSVDNDECRIDSLPQTWAVISETGDPERARQAMQSVDRQLVRRDDKLALLFTPPFDRGSLQPGYIKGYVPGIRENGGQYTHAAFWVVQAFAMLGDGDNAGELLEILNPISHTSTEDAVKRFRLEPYVVPADVYSEPKHVGRGGWSWYTGSAGWFYRVVLENFLGFELHGASFHLKPNIPSSWPGFELLYRFHTATYKIRVKNHAGRQELARNSLDGNEVESNEFPLIDDGRIHEVIVHLNAAPTSTE
jgi:cyclic beta-1,2-glucan synthetase